MSKNVSMTESIEINASPEQLFDYISNGNNDPLWRTEVKRMDVQGETKQGTLMVEYSTFYHFLHTVTPTQIKVLESPNKLILETPDGHPTWLRSTRTVEKLENGHCKFTYELAFSLDTMKQISPITPPAGLITMWYRPRIIKYLKNLKRILE
jgi:hypothetical protein